MNTKFNRTVTTIAFALSLLLLPSCTTQSHTASKPPSVRAFTAATTSTTLGGFDLSKFGHPKGMEVQVLKNIGYTSGYSSDTRTPLWVSYYLAAEMPYEVGDRPKFRADSRVEDPVDEGDYRNTGYDQGHLAPNAPIAKRYGFEAQDETFLLTNIMPQLPGLNQRGWEALEKVISEKYAVDFDGVKVFVGPIFEGECWELKTDIKIPSHCYMVIVDVDESDGKVYALGVVMEQRRVNREQLSDFVTTIDDIEARTGLDFLHELPDDIEARVESSEPDGRWDTSQYLKPTFAGISRKIVRRRCN